ncbi:MAG: dihydroorotate dehydrogenase-like protein [Pseudomonadota bacterium]
MTDLTTTYLGLKLAHPFTVGACPLADDLDTVLRLEDAGASMIGMRSLFEEQIAAEQAEQDAVDRHCDSFGEALSFLPDPAGFKLGPDDYLEQIRKVKGRTKIPVVASLNGTTQGGWTRYAKSMQEAGADALELNFYAVVTDPKATAEKVENDLLELVKSVKKTVRIPVAVKLSPFFTSLPCVAEKLDKIPVDGIVLFNRFYQPDIDVENLKIERSLKLSDSSELLLRLHGLAILSGQVKASLAASGGVHTGLDAVKALMSGAHVVQMVSTLLKNGPQRLKANREEVTRWLDDHEYSSVREMIGSMNLMKCPDPKALERLNYMEVLQGWK